MSAVPTPIQKDAKVPTETNIAGGLIVRRLDKPYFELRTKDAQSSSYLEGDLRRLIDEEPQLRRFLAEATIQLEPTSGSQKRRVIHYAVDPAKYPNLRPMDSLPEGEWKEFCEAATEFYAKIDDESVNKFEKVLRMHFKLPDPIKEPDAYYVYGEDFERKLLILWGCEKERDSALPLLRHPSLKLREDEKTVDELLKTKLITWAQMQRDALLLLTKNHEPLLRFLGRPILEKGILKGIVLADPLGLAKPAEDGTDTRVTLKAEAVKPLRYLLPPEMDVFQKACQAFYQKADAAPSEYERDLRLSFRLPDLARAPKHFYVTGPAHKLRLIVLYEGNLLQEATNYLTPFPAKQIPPARQLTPEQELLGEKASLSKTLTDQLREKTIPLVKIIAAAAAVVAAPILAAVIVWLMLDKTPPTLAQKKDAFAGAPDPSTLIVRFNEELAPASINTNAFKLFIGDSEPIKIRSIKLGGEGPFKNREVILVADKPFFHTSNYLMGISGVRDAAYLHNEMKSLAAPFEYADASPPILGVPSGDGVSRNRLIVPFNEPLDKTAAETAANYSIDGSFKVNSATLEPDGTSVALMVSPQLTLQSNYVLKVSRVKDAILNTMTNAIAPFKYVDILAPKLLGEPRVPDQLKIVLEFNEPLSTNSANPANFTLSASADGSSLAVYHATIASTPELPKTPGNVPNGRFLVLEIDPLSPGAEYSLEIRDIGDLAPKPNLLANLTKTIAFTGSPNAAGPQLTKATVNDDFTKVTVYFVSANRLKRDARIDTNSFKITFSPSTNQPSVASFPVPVLDITENQDFAGAPPGLEKLTLIVGPGLERGRNYKVEGRSLVDIYGRTNTTSAVLPLGGLIQHLAAEFTDLSPDNKKVTIQFTKSIQKEGLSKANFEIQGADIESAALGGKENDIITLFLKTAMKERKIRGVAKHLVPVGTSIAAPPIELLGPNKSQ